jgi:hypothetical protein
MASILSNIKYNLISFFDGKYEKIITVLPSNFKLTWDMKLFRNRDKDDLNYLDYFKYVIDSSHEILFNEKTNLDVWSNLYTVKIIDVKSTNNYDEISYVSGPALEKYSIIVHVNFESYIKILYCVKKEKKKNSAHGFCLPALAFRYNYIMHENESYYVSKVSLKYCQLSSENFKINNFQVRKLLSKRMIIEICYDCETIVMEGFHQPYLLFATWNKNYCYDSEFGEFTYVLEDTSDLTKSNAGQAFVDWIFSFNMELFPYEYEFYIFGYNSDRFDLNFIVNEFRNKKNIKMNYLSREGKITEFVANWQNTIFRFKDIFKYIPDMSLKDACLFYEVDDRKMDVDIVKYNNMSKAENKLILTFEDKKDFESCLKNAGVVDKIKISRKYYDEVNKNYKIFDLIIDYCKADVIATMALFNVIQSSYEEIVKELVKQYDVVVKYKNIFEFISVPSMAFYFFKLIAKKENRKHLTFLNQELANFIYQSFIAGRTCFSLLGKYNVQEFGYFDIRSQYPLVMKGLFPVVDDKDDILIGLNIDYESLEEDVLNLKKMRNYYIFEKRDFESVHYFNSWDKKKGIYMCSIYPPKETTEIISCFPPVAQRIFDKSVNDKKLIYLNIEQKHRILTSDHIKTLIYGGWDVQFEKNPNDIQFLKCDYFFKSYVDFFSYYKTKAKADGNKALAKWAKGLLNYLYGKTCLSPTSMNTCQYGASDEDGTYFCDSFKFEKDDWSQSLHYLAVFITSQANWILFSTLYRLSQHYVVDKIPHEMRTGSLIYVDTDSIIYDKKLCYDLKFEISEELGHYDESKSDFFVTWGTKYANAEWIIVYSKKCYIIGKKEKILSCKLKGVHRFQAELFNYENFIKMLTHKKVIKFISLQRNKKDLSNFSSTSNYLQDFLVDIVENEFQKTLQIEKIAENEEIKTKNDVVYSANKQNIDKEVFKVEGDKTYTYSLTFLFR